ncbi:YdcF family protein [Sphingosinicella microcystinivorans]|uniref:YdcF family protein n=1 Tax=Sphingosinicella microcystinivorans TaxID=335406 RepID=UPI0022F3B308|nr:YdcF family protein [Sphingosinicella microcystinivorans]WBX82479.1 YdcF family protein [Sphingosinicella microcystinivorans]
MTSVLVRSAMLLALAWIAGFVWFVMSLPEPAPDDIRTEGIVVLTGGPGRIARGVDLLRAGKADRLLISGVDASVRPIELAIELNVPADVFECCIDLGKQAADTRGNGEEIAAWVRQYEYTSVRLVTSQFHVARATAEARARVGAGVTLVPDAVPARMSARVLALEYSKFLFRRLLLLMGEA